VNAAGLTPMGWIAVLVAGMLFGAGLAASSMVRPEVVLAFLRFQDFGLLLVMGAAAGITAIAYALAPRVLAKPPFAARFGTHPSRFDRPTLVGAAIFGIGWGLAGVCPGPAIAGLGTGNQPLLWSVAGMLAGAYVQGRIPARRCRAPPAPDDRSRRGAARRIHVAEPFAGAPLAEEVGKRAP
jgi:uncharacterized protein